MQVSILERLARVEAVTNKLRAEMDDVLRNAYDIACEAQDEEMAATIARKIRNRLLDESDKSCTLDKMLPDAPSGTTFTSWLSWLKKLAAIKTNEWGTYRQQLRDLTEQEGFPLSVEWPKVPGEADELSRDV